MKRIGRMAVCLLPVLLVACGEEERSNVDPEPEPAPVEVGPVAMDPTYELRAEASGPYQAGQAGAFEIRLVPRGDHHVNVRYPLAVSLEGPEQIAFAEASLDREDAQVSEERASFDVPFTASAAGSHRVTATVDFAVCTPETCIPEQRTLALVLPVE